jgi:hypothetical protein
MNALQEARQAMAELQNAIDEEDTGTILDAGWPTILAIEEAMRAALAIHLKKIGYPQCE